MYITGPDVVKSVTNEVVSHQELGGAEVHNQKSGVAHFLYDNEQECFKQVRRLLRLPAPELQCQAEYRLRRATRPSRTDEALFTLVPDDPRLPYDMKKVINTIVDNGDFMEVQAQIRPQHHLRTGAAGG